MHRVACYSVVALLLLRSPFAAAGAASPTGHWEGSIKTPAGDLKLAVDLDQDEKGLWRGDIDIPDQMVRDLPLRDISVSGETVTFRLPAGPGEPTFSGKLSADGAALSGDFTQAGTSMPFNLKRTGEAHVAAPEASPALPEQFTGTWEGKLEPPGGTLWIVFHLSNKDGSAAGTVDSPDQGISDIPMSRITSDGVMITIAVRMVAGEFKGKISADGKTLTGEWSQGGAALPLVLTRK